MLSETTRKAMILTKKTESRANEMLSLYDCDIPDCLLTEILIRLPLKSIFLFKTVSKRWLSLISDAFFARSFVTRINNDPLLSRSHRLWVLLSPYLLKKVSPHEMELIQYPTALHPAGFSTGSSSGFSLSFLPFHTEDPIHRRDILASSNGLVLCCRDECPPTYYVCNPLTKHYVILPKPLTKHYAIPPELPRGRNDAGFICEEDGSYTVVRIPNHESSSKMLVLEIFSSKTGTWGEFKFSCPVHNHSRRLRRWYYSTVSHKGILYWTADKGENIFAYDPYRSTDQCYSMDLPNCTTERSVIYRLAICCDRLCCFVAGESLKLWELSNYESGKWHLKHTSKLSDMRSNDAGLREILGKFYFWPLTIHPFDLDTVYVTRKGGCLMSYNFRTRMLEVVDSGWFPGCIHRFVLPPWPTLIPQPSWIYK